VRNLQRKLLIKRKKKLLGIANYISKIDEFSVNFHGNSHDNLFKKIKLSFEESLSKKKKISNFVSEMKGLSGRKYRSLINSLISKIRNPSYLEIGSWLGSTTCSAALNNDLKITCIDNWSQLLLNEKYPQEKFKKNINKCITKKTELILFNNDFREINYNEIGKHNIFLFDGPHHFKDHYDGIILAQPALKKKYILIVDDWNWDQVRAGTKSAILDLELNVISKLEIRTTNDGSSALITGENSDWHQGCCFFVIEK
tara:strand:- start:16 stop:783 length:768 start_codon:yes stop_codon:yes gene_type:complete